MDYARFNYVAQPGDDTCFTPLIGPYDKFAIEWGYRPMPEADSPDAERARLNAEVAKMQVDPIYRFSSPTGADPTALTEAIGDDAMRASDYGIANLERVVGRLRDWTYEEGEDYSQLAELYNNVSAQWNRYTGHVLANVGGVVQTRKVQGQDGPPFVMVPKEKQERAVEYLNRQVFATPDWLLDTAILDRIQGSGAPDQVRQRQVAALNGLLNVPRMKRLIEQEAFHGTRAYTLTGMFDRLWWGVWQELAAGPGTDTYRRNLQRAYLDRMGELLEDEDALQTDIAPNVRDQLGKLREELSRAPPSDEATQIHYRDSIVRIDRILNPNG